MGGSHAFSLDKNIARPDALPIEVVFVNAMWRDAVRFNRLSSVWRMDWRTKMNIHELVIEMKLLERRLTLYEEKYGVLSEDFYHALTLGELARYDEYDETRADFSRWKGIYETWRRRKEAYASQIQQRDLAETLRVQPAY